MLIERTKVPGAVVITPDVYIDERGYFKETCSPYMNFVPAQGNQSYSHKGVIRGLHEQDGAAKLVWVVKGSIYDVVFNLETGKWDAVALTAENHKQLFVPENMYHGFQALEDDTIVCYMMSMYYDPNFEHSINPEFIDWPLKRYILSEKDKNADKLLS